MQFLLIKVPKANEYTIEQTYALLSNLAEPKKASLLFLKKKENTYSLEIVCLNQKINFVVGVPDNKVEFFKAQLLAQFKEAIIENYKFSTSKNQAPLISKNQVLLIPNLQTNWCSVQLTCSRPDYLPLKTTEQFKDTDPLSSILATMAKSENPDYFFLYQILLSPANKNWQDGYLHLAQTGGGKQTYGGDHPQSRSLPHPQKMQIELKVKHPGFKTYIRILTNKPETLEALSGSFGVFTDPSGNSLCTSKPGMLSKKKLIQSILERKPFGKNQILNVAEIASLWHIPGALITLPNIGWGKQLRTEPPENLPTATGANKEEKQQITFIGKTEFKNQEATFGIKRSDRPRHIYVIGKTGTGKSWLLANMIIEDIRKGEGVAVVDPHGDLVQIVLDYIPASRINEVCLFNPADPDYAYPLNPLEVTNMSQRELVASGIVAIFYKLYAHSWGPRMEHILRNTLLTLTAVPNTTLADVIGILTDRQFRNKILSQLTDKNLVRYWEKEFEPMGDKMMQEAISPILNKVGQYVSSPLIRKNIIWPQSKVKIEEIMNQGKILLCDLSSGKIGEDNSALLGAMVVTQIQQAAMNRAFIPESERKPFYLYVDEFQNFATTSFIKILSEARKYKLNLTVANQYMDQLDEEIQDAILGNVGTLISFVVGSRDAYILEREFGKLFTQDDLVTLGRYQILLKLCVDNQTSTPFFASTMPLPACINQNKEKIIKNSRERFGRKVS